LKIYILEIEKYVSSVIGFSFARGRTKRQLGQTERRGDTASTEWQRGQVFSCHQVHHCAAAMALLQVLLVAFCNPRAPL